MFVLDKHTQKQLLDFNTLQLPVLIKINVHVSTVDTVCTVPMANQYGGNNWFW